MDNNNENKIKNCKLPTAESLVGVIVIAMLGMMLVAVINADILPGRSKQKQISVTEANQIESRPDLIHLDEYQTVYTMTGDEEISKKVLDIKKDFNAICMRAYIDMKLKEHSDQTDMKLNDIDKRLKNIEELLEKNSKGNTDENNR